jgi:hypothetical protein
MDHNLFSLFPSSDLVFIMGLRRSGTSWIQSILNTHPSIVTRIEDSAEDIVRLLRTSLSSYNRTLKQRAWENDQLDNVSLHPSDDFHQLVRFYFEITAKNTLENSDKKKSQFVVFRDFSLSSYFGLFAELFPQARFIYVIRDPRDAAISTWYHHKRIDDGYEQKTGNLQYHARNYAREWVKDYNRVFFHPSVNNVAWHLVRYEDLFNDFEETVQKLFEFLDIKIKKSDRIAKIQESTNFSSLTDGRKNGQVDENAYLRSGDTNIWQDELEQRTVDIMDAISHRHMQSLGYHQETEEEQNQEVEETPPLVRKNLKKLASKKS